MFLDTLTATLPYVILALLMQTIVALLLPVALLHYSQPGMVPRVMAKVTLWWAYATAATLLIQGCLYAWYMLTGPGRFLLVIFEASWLAQVSLFYALTTVGSAILLGIARLIDGQMAQGADTATVKEAERIVKEAADET